jgi:hypothetical protein
MLFRFFSFLLVEVVGQCIPVAVDIRLVFVCTMWIRHPSLHKWIHNSFVLMPGMSLFLADKKKKEKNNNNK